MRNAVLKRTITLSCFVMFGLSIQAQTNNSSRIYEVWDDQPAPNRGKNYRQISARGFPIDKDWEAHSYPIGNGFMGANVFGRTDVERIQITDKTLTNGAPYGTGGMTNFAEVFIDFDHYDVEDYKRSLNLNDGILNVNYEYDGVKYSREYFASYPNNVIAIRLTADKKSKLSCTVSAVNPYLRNSDEIMISRGITNKYTKYGTTTAQGNTITIEGSVPSFSLNYEGQIRVVNMGGRLIANNDNGSNEIRIVGADSALILIAVGTNYELNEHIFLTDDTQQKLDPTIKPHDSVTKRIDAACGMGYEALKDAHFRDYRDLYARVDLQFADKVPNIPTKTLVENYKHNVADSYLEELMFHFGRYLLIASSRKGTLPSSLQGVWSQYHVSPWSAGYWHNINVQMNYWGAFNANLAETFTAYEEYFMAYLPKAYENGGKYIKEWHPAAYENEAKGNGWCIGTGANAYHIESPGGHSGPGTGGFTAKLFWDRYEYTRDTTFLRTVAYPALLGMSTFLSKTLVPAENGLLLVERSASPEQSHQGGYYMTKGTTFDQGFVWETYNDLLKSAKILGIENGFIDNVQEQINHLAPIQIGESGQIKEYREEKEYGDIGDPKHRHISHLCTIYPGTIINSSHPDWVEAASRVLDFRGNETTGWAMAHRMNVRARTKEAEKAHEVYSKFLSERTSPNLWTLHPPFQIDGNLGTMAGVAEMLLQSHEGFIEILPALPKDWETGAFSGLVARGNFELSAKWKKSKIVSFSILSKSGGVCKIKWTHSSKIQIEDEEGVQVAYTIDSDNIVRFDTDKQIRYFIK